MQPNLIHQMVKGYNTSLQGLSRLTAASLFSSSNFRVFGHFVHFLRVRGIRTLILDLWTLRTFTPPHRRLSIFLLLFLNLWTLRTFTANKYFVNRWTQSAVGGGLIRLWYFVLTSRAAFLGSRYFST
jgi:hypothetical protein